MATTYKSTVEINCWKQHTCKGCNSLFRYRMTRKCAGSANTPDKAKAKAQKAAEAALQTFDLQPCPQCGLLQPEMIGQSRARTHKLCAWLSAGALVVVYILTVCHAITMNIGAIAAAVVCALFGVWQVLTSIRDLNANLEGNRQLAKTSMNKAALILDKPGSGSTGYSIGGLAVQHKFALIFLAVGTLAVVSPEFARMGSGWPLNGDCYPPVVGPGDTTRLYLGGSITSVHGYWTGVSKAEVPNPADAGLAAADVAGFKSSSNYNTWGNSISAKSSEKSNSSSIWADLTVPPSPALAGKDLTIKVDVQATYPQLVGSNGFTEASSPFSYTGPLHLAAAGAGAAYSSMFWYAGLIGSALFLFGSIRLTALANGLKKQGNPTQVAPVGTDNP